MKSVMRYGLIYPNGLFRQNLDGTGKNGSLYFMLTTSHGNLCGNLNIWLTKPFCTLPGELTWELTVISMGDPGPI